MRARLAARICSSLIVWAIDAVAKTTATADMLRNEDIDRIRIFMALLFISTSVVAFLLYPWAALHNPSNHGAIEDSRAA
jgi:hypothetical protein